MPLPLTPTTTTAVNLDELKQHLGKDLTRNVDDTELLRFLVAAETKIGHYTGPLVGVEVTEKHDGGGTLILLRSPRAVSLTSVAYADGSTSTLTDFDLDTDTGILYKVSGCFPVGRRNVLPTYVAGFASLPHDLDLGVKELVRHLWLTQRGANTARLGFQDVDAPVVVGAHSSWPIRVQELVDPYIIAGVA